MYNYSPEASCFRPDDIQGQTVFKGRELIDLAADFLVNVLAHLQSMTIPWPSVHSGLLWRTQAAETVKHHSCSK
jgi:hypothetical protein